MNENSSTAKNGAEKMRFGEIIKNLVTNKYFLLVLSGMDVEEQSAQLRAKRADSEE